MSAKRTPNGFVKWTRREIPDFVWNVIKDKSPSMVVRAVNSHEALLEIVKELQQVIKIGGDLQLGPKGRHAMLEERVNQAIAQAEERP